MPARDAIGFGKTPHDWKPLPFASNATRGYGETRALFDAGRAEGDRHSAKVKVLVRRRGAQDETDFFAEELREWIEAVGAPNGRQMEHPLDGVEEGEELHLGGILAMVWRLNGGSYVRTPPKAGWGHGGERVIAAALAVPAESWGLVLGGPPRSVDAAADGFVSWVRSASLPE